MDRFLYSSKTLRRRRTPSVAALRLRRPPDLRPQKQSALLVILPWAVITLALMPCVLLILWFARTAGSSNETTNQSSDALVVSVLSEPLPDTMENVNSAASDVSSAASADLFVAGDVMLGRYVETLMDKYGKDYPFLHFDDTLAHHDLVLANLEGPIDTAHSQTPDNSLIFSFTPNVASLLQRHGFTVLSTANNHGSDQGSRGAKDTKEALVAAGISPLGDPRRVSVDDVVFKTIDGEEIAMLGFNAVSSTFPSTTAIDLIRTVRTEHQDAYILVFPHWGNEYQTSSSGHQQTLAHAFIDAGADAVLGSHPHVVQEAEVYNHRLIVYSLGNLIFDQYFSPETQEGLALDVTVRASSITYTFLPFTSRLSQPTLMPDAQMKTWLATYAQRSSIDAMQSGTLELERTTTVE